MSHGQWRHLGRGQKPDSQFLYPGIGVRVPSSHNQKTRAGEILETLRFFVFERTKHQPRRNLRSYLVLQRLCNEAALSPGMMHFCTKSWSKMVVSWRYADLSMESGWSGQEMFV